MKKNRVRLIICGLVFIPALISGLFLIWQKRASFSFQNGQAEGGDAVNDGRTSETQSNLPKNPISGLPCENANRRPIAIMLSSDKEARPLSSISQADLVFEMQVVEGSVTRLMEVFICQDPQVIGSVRSARHDFIPLAAGLDAIYAHWGGSHFALDKLKTGIIDNLDALPNPNNVFYRQSGIAMPHDGFTSMARMINTAGKLGYRTTGKFSGYPHYLENELLSGKSQAKVLRVDYSGEFRVSYEYDHESNSYFRFRGNLKEIDKNTGQQVEAKNIVIMRAESWPLEGDYNEVQVEGEGKAEYYLNGEFFKGTWEKDKKNIASKLFFYNEKGEEVKFVQGSIWVEIVDPGLAVSWQ